MNKVIEILMRRDGISQQEAKALVEDAREQILDANGSFDAAEDIMQEVLGLEPDYIFDVLY